MELFSQGETKKKHSLTQFANGQGLRNGSIHQGTPFSSATPFEDRKIPLLSQNSQASDIDPSEVSSTSATLL